MDSSIKWDSIGIYFHLSIRSEDTYKILFTSSININHLIVICQNPLHLYWKDLQQSYNSSTDLSITLKFSGIFRVLWKKWIFFMYSNYSSFSSAKDSSCLQCLFIPLNQLYIPKTFLCVLPLLYLYSILTKKRILICVLIFHTPSKLSYLFA